MALMVCSGKPSRLEKYFYQRTHGLLQVGGVMVLILPSTSFDKQLSGWVATHFRYVRCSAPSLTSSSKLFRLGSR